MALLFFKIFSIKINAILHALEPIFDARFPLQNTQFESINRFFSVKKYWSDI